MEFPNDKIESCFRKALSGKSIDMYNLICAYLEDKDNPDSIERAYQLTLRMRNMVDQTIQQKEIRRELTIIFKRFLLGYHGFKYIDFPYYWNSFSKSATFDIIILSKELTNIKDRHWSTWIEACKSFTNQHDNETTMGIANSIKSGGLLPAACHMMGYLYEEREVQGYCYDQREALRLYKRAAKYGSIPGMKKVLYLLSKANNMESSTPDDLETTQFACAIKVAELGDTESMVDVGTYYKYGNGTTKDDRQALIWLYKAVLSGYDSRQELAELLIRNSLFEPRYGEAYSWLQSYNLQYPLFIRENERKELTEAIIAHLSPKYRGLPNKLAEVYRKRFDSCGMIVPYMAQDLDSYLDYLLDKFAEGDTLFDATVEIAKFLLPTTSKRVESKVDNDDRFNDTSPATETIASNNIVYSFINLVASNFQINKVKLELEIGRKLDKNEELDYTKIMITYDGKYKDTKEARICEPIKVNKKARQLLLCLACQISAKDKEKRAYNVASILREHKEEPSRLNAMFKLMFPNCGLPNKSCMINKDRGTIQVCLSIKDPTNKIDSERCNMCQYSPYKC